MSPARSTPARSFRLPALLLLSAWLAGCAALRPPPPPSEEALAALAALRTFNGQVRTFKGTGAVEMVRDGARQTGRMAWVGKGPAHLRASLLDPVGRPRVTLVADGEIVAARSEADGDDFRTRTADPGLNRVLGIPVRAREIIRLLAGQAPMAHPHSMVLENDRLRLLDRWNRTIQIAEMDPEHRRPRALEHFSGGERRYRAEFGPFSEGPDGILEPSRITILGPADAARFDLRIDRFWTNHSLPAGAFRLERSE